MAQIFKIRQPNGDVVTPGDWTSAEPLWTTVEFGEGPVQVLVGFSYGVGAPAIPGADRKATDGDTNLQGEGNRLPENEEIVIFNIACELFAIGGPGTSEDDFIPPSDPPEVSALNLLRCQRDILVSLRFGSVNRTYIEAPLGYFPASTGVKNYTSGARTEFSNGADGFVSANNGGHNAHDIRELSSPLRIRGGQTFGLDFEAGPGEVVGLNVNDGDAPGRIRIRTFLDGYRRRPVA